MRSQSIYFAAELTAKLNTSMSKNLLIVESPAKAKTIEKFLGKDYKVVSSYGHIRDLPSGKTAVDVEKDFEPEYVVPDDKKELVAQLKKEAGKASEVWLATDEDREGEAISWHLCEVLGLDPEKTKRIVFHEITKNAIEQALENPRYIDKNLVMAQQARRILDRLVGFEMSPLLWRKMSMKGALSAGRVQSVAVRLIVEREREIMDFLPVSSFKVSALFRVKGKDGREYKLKATLNHRFETLEEAEAFIKSCKEAGFRIADIKVKPAKKSPAAPFTTSTLQQEASRKLGYSVAKTMMIAQRLYESGKITYMRTDSLNLSQTAIEKAAEVISKEFGADYSKPRHYKTKKAGAQEAHEAIRPTFLENRQIEGSNDEMRLYDLIWKRTIASQMADARLERTTITIDLENAGLNQPLPYHFDAKGEVIKFDGFLKVYFESKDEEVEEEDLSILPPVEKGQELKRESIEARERFTKHPPRYTEASLVKKLEELGIGRPSTYAPTISTIQKRGYVEKVSTEGKARKFWVIRLSNGEPEKHQETEITGAEKNKLFPTDLGMIVTDFLKEYFKDVMDYSFTASVEKEFDEIAYGKKEWRKMLEGFYNPFHKAVEETMENASRVTGERLLGEDPASGKPVYAKMGKYGPMIQIGSTDSEEKPKFAKMRPDQKIPTVTLEEAMELFKLPRTIGTFEDEEIVAAEGRFGPYLRHKGKFYSLKEIHPLDINLEQAIEVIEAKREADKKKTIRIFEEDDIQILNGRYGPYIKHKGKNFKIPKDINPAEITLEKAKDLIENAPPPRKKGKRTAGRKK